MKCGLAIHLHMAKWCHIPCAPIEWRTPQHHDRWHTQCRYPLLASPAANMQTIAAWGHGDMPIRFEWWVRSLTVYFPGASLLGCCCPWWIHPWTTADRSGPVQQCTAWECDNHHPDSFVHTSSPPLWQTSLCLLVILPQPSTCNYRGPWNGRSRLSPQLQPLSPSGICQRESHHQWPWGLSPQQEKQKIPLDQGGWTQPSQPQWQPLCRHPHGWPHPMAPPASLTLHTHCSSPPCWGHQRWWAGACSSQECTSQTVR